MYGLFEIVVSIPVTGDLGEIHDCIYAQYVPDGLTREIIGFSFGRLTEIDGNTQVVIRYTDSAFDALGRIEGTAIDVPHVGTTHRFSVSANAMKSKSGRKLPFAPHDTEGRLRWLEGQGERGGFEVVEADEIDRWVETIKTRKRDIRIPASWFVGTLRVTDRRLFHRVLLHGIGRGKTWGLGMVFLLGQTEGLAGG